MSDPTKPAPVLSPPAAIENWSGISQGDLGMKIVYWLDPEKTGMRFREIVGWVVATTQSPAFPIKGFVPIVIGDNWVPTAAVWVPNYLGIVPKEATEQEVRDKMDALASDAAAKNSPPPTMLN
jgi:hypothetical protein